MVDCLALPNVRCATILSLEGNAGVGKSTLMYSAPTPMVVLAFDAGSNRALYGSMHTLFTGIDVQIVPYPHRFMEQDVTKDLMPMVRQYWKRNEGKAITVYMLPEPIQMGPKLEGVRYLWNEFKLLVDAALADPEIPTVGIDTGTIMRRVAIDWHLETLQATPNGKDRLQLLQIEYGKPNDQVRAVYATAQNICEYAAMTGGQKNFIVTHHMDDVYVMKPNARGEMESFATGQEQLAGLKDTYRYVDVALRLEKSQVAGSKAGTQMSVIDGEFMKCGYDLSLEHQKIKNPTWDSLVEMVNTNLAPQAQVKKRG